MKIVRVLLTMGLAFCGAVAGFAQEPSPPSAKLAAPGSSEAQKSDEKARLLVQQAIEALGGPAYLDVHDVQQQGRTYSLHHGESTSNGVQFWRFVALPDKERLEITKQRDIAYVYNGEKGYEITYKGAGPIEAKELSEYLRRRKFSLDTVLREWSKTKGVAVFDEGPALSGNRPAEQVTLVNLDNNAVTLLLDPANHLPLGKKFSWRDPVDKQLNLEEETYDNYRLVGGIMTPYNVTRFFNGDMTNQRFLNSVLYNQNPPTAMFDPNSGYSSNKQAGKR